MMVACFCLPRISHAADAATEKLIEGAKKEGELVYYNSMNMEESTALIPRFEKKYPFLKVRLNRNGSEKLLTKVVAEHQAKRTFADVVQTVEFSMYTLRKLGIIGQYLSPEDRFFPKEFKEQGFWTCTYCNAYVIVYSTRHIPKDQVPKTYEDLLKPQWKGKMMIDATKVDWFAGMLQIMGKEKGVKFMKDLAAQKLSPRIGHTLICQLVGAGEADMGLDQPASSVDRLKEKGAPIDWVALGPVPGVMIGIGVTANAPHPNAARLYIDYILSEEAQSVLKGFGRNVVRTDIPVPAKYKAMKVVPVNPALADNINEYETLSRGIFQNK
jgi:iron(III) transport system substrate-binding protein